MWHRLLISSFTHLYTYIRIYIYTYIRIRISGWIFQKVLAEIVQKDLILSQKALISNRRNLGSFAPTSIAFLQKIANRKISLFNCLNFLRAIFPFSQNALERLYCSVILTAGFRSVFVSLLRNTRVSALVSGLNQIPHKLAATFWDVCCLKCPN